MKTLGLILMTAALSVAAAHGQTYVPSQYINTDTTWGAWGSPYIIQGDVTVINGVTLTIQAGVTVAFDGPYNLSTAYNGVIVGDGQPGNRILFTSNAVDPEPEDWHYVQIFGGGPASFQHCVFEYAYDGVRANDSVVTLTNCVFRHCNYGVNCLDSAPTITGSRVTACMTGIRILGPSDHPIIDSCDIFGNGQWNVSVGNLPATATIPAENCWWGSADEAVIADSILDGVDYPQLLATVDYEPWQGALPSTPMSWGGVKAGYGE